jgi:hypothetical protein
LKTKSAKQLNAVLKLQELLWVVMINLKWPARNFKAFPAIN